MSNTVSALFYLWSRTALNVARVRLSRLKQPKYLFGAAIAIAYFGMVFIGPLLRRAARAERAAAEGGPLELPDLSHIASSAVMVVLALSFAAMWLWRRPRAALNFSEAEVAFLFTGPVKHSALVHYSLLRTLAGVLFGAFFISMMTLAWSVPSTWWMRFLGWWLILSVFALHLTASGFVMTRLLNRGVAQWQRQLGVAAALALLFLLFNLLDPAFRLPTAGETVPAENLAAYVYGQIDRGPLYWLLLPLRAVAMPFVASDALSFLIAFALALLVLALHYFWAFACEVPDAEATLGKARKLAQIREAMQQGNMRLTLEPPKARREPFKLAARGTPVVAFLWKNLLSTREYMNWRTALVLVGLMFAWDWWIGTPPRYGFIAAIPTLLAALLAVQTLLIGAHVARQDLRMDLENADLIKTWPLQGWQIVLGELLAPSVILTVILWLCLLQIGLSLESPNRPWLTPELRLQAGFSLSIVLPFLCAAQLFIANAAAVLFPAWTKIGGSQNMGIEVMGQRMVFMVGQWLVMFVMLLPALLFGLLVYIPASWFIDNFALLPAALTAALVLAAELAWGISWLGERFDAYDLSA